MGMIMGTQISPKHGHKVANGQRMTAAMADRLFGGEGGGG